LLRFVDAGKKHESTDHSPKGERRGYLGRSPERNVTRHPGVVSPIYPPLISRIFRPTDTETPRRTDCVPGNDKYAGSSHEIALHAKFQDVSDCKSQFQGATSVFGINTALTLWPYFESACANNVTLQEDL
jgi:hypothetical protein